MLYPKFQLPKLPKANKWKLTKCITKNSKERERNKQNFKQGLRIKQGKISPVQNC